MDMKFAADSISLKRAL